MTATNNPDGNLMALDVGMARVGVAIASSIARLPSPYVTLQNDGDLWQRLQDVCRAESIGLVIVGLPRGLDGQETAQTAYCRQFAEHVRAKLGTEVVLQDEALTSKKAEAELQNTKAGQRGADVDSLAATYILEDYLKDV